MNSSPKTIAWFLALMLTVGGLVGCGSKKNDGAAKGVDGKGKDTSGQNPTDKNKTNQTKAADKKATGTQKAGTSREFAFVSDQAFAAMHVNIERIAATPAIQGALKSKVSALVRGEFPPGIGPEDIKEVMSVFTDPSMESPPTIIFTFTKDIVVDKLKESLPFKKSVKQTYKDVEYFAGEFESRLLVFGKRQALFTHGELIKQCIDAGQTPSGTLVQRLKKLDLDNDFTMVGVVTEPLRAASNEMLEGGIELPEQLKGVKQLASSIQGATLVANVSSGPLLEIRISADKTNAATEIKAMVEALAETGKQMAQQAAPMIDQVAPKDLAAVGKELVGQVISGLLIRVDGTDLVCSIKRPAALDKVTTKHLTDLMEAATPKDEWTEFTNTKHNFQVLFPRPLDEDDMQFETKDEAVFTIEAVAPKALYTVRVESMASLGIETTDLRALARRALRLTKEVAQGAKDAKLGGKSAVEVRTPEKGGFLASRTRVTMTESHAYIVSVGYREANVQGIDFDNFFNSFKFTDPNQNKNDRKKAAKKGTDANKTPIPTKKKSTTAAKGLASTVWRR